MIHTLALLWKKKSRETIIRNKDESKIKKRLSYKKKNRMEGIREHKRVIFAFNLYPYVDVSAFVCVCVYVYACLRERERERERDDRNVGNLWDFLRENKLDLGFEYSQPYLKSFEYPGSPAEGCPRCNSKQHPVVTLQL